MGRKYVDLHIHTTFSDGLLDPCRLVEEAKERRIAAIGITDHDTMQGVGCAEAAGRKHGVEVVPGVELSVVFAGKEIHLLGYFCHPENSLLKSTLEVIKASRYDRMSKMIDKLKELGVNIELAEVLEQAGGEMPGRPHLAMAICRKGYCRTPAEVFAKYIGNHCQAYVERYKLTLQEALKLLYEAGGIPVLAHPGLYNADEIIPPMVSMGLRGIEAFHPEHDSADRYRYVKIAREYNLLITGGSDYHGKGLGSSDFIGTVKLDYRYLDKLKAAKANLFEKMI
jgi:predicted metal-dependent phosphoesterase TrpH